MALEGELSVEVQPNHVYFVYEVRNEGDESMNLTFRTGQRFDIVVTDGEGTIRWQASEGRLYTMAVTMSSIDPGETWSFDEETTDLIPGDYEAVAQLAADEADATATVTFEVG